MKQRLGNLLGVQCILRRCWDDTSCTIWLRKLLQSLPHACSRPPLTERHVPAARLKVPALKAAQAAVPHVAGQPAHEL